MKNDEFAFANRQLAGMLKSGIPLEGALRQLCQGMSHGATQQEFRQLEADLSQGIPFSEALAKRNLPRFYTQVIQTGAQSNDLPSVLTLLADYYERMNFLWTRMKGLMVYPLLVLLISFGLSVFLTFLYKNMILSFKGTDLLVSWASPPRASQILESIFTPNVCLAGIFLPMFFLAALLVGAALLLFSPAIRRKACWMLPGFKEAHLSRFASSLSLMLKSGCSLNQSLGLLRQMEAGTPMGDDLSTWESRLSAGQGKFIDFAKQSKFVPPLFIWLVSSDEENWEPGLARAAEIYYARAVYRCELLLNSCLPVSILLLGTLVSIQVFSLARLLSAGLTLIGCMGEL